LLRIYYNTQIRTDQFSPNIYLWLKVESNEDQEAKNRRTGWEPTLSIVMNKKSGYK